MIKLIHACLVFRAVLLRSGVPVIVLKETSGLTLCHHGSYSLCQSDKCGQVGSTTRPKNV